MTRKKLGAWIEQHEWFLFVLAGVTILRIPSLFEPYWYGDEAIYLTIGHALRNGIALYSQIHDNKPPLIYLMSAIANGNQFWLKFILMIWNLLTVAIFGILALKFFDGRKKVQKITTWLFALVTTLPIIEGNIANAELFFILFSLLTVLMLWKRDLTKKKIFLAGLLLGIGGLFKMPVLLEAGVWPLVWLVTREKKWWIKSVLFASGVAVPIVVSIVYFWATGSGMAYIMAAWAQNLPYLSSWKTGSEGVGIYSLKGRAAISFVLLAFILGWSRRIGRRGTILGLWWVIGLFAVLLSGRPYPHYLLQISAIAALGMGILGWGQKYEKLLTAGMIAVTAASIYAFHFYTYPTVSYYSNFIQWTLGVKNRSQYFAWFDPQVMANYEITQAIKAGSRGEEKIFVWGDNPVFYALAKRLPLGKYTVAYHIKELHQEKETIGLLSSKLPKYIIVTLPENELPGLSGILYSNYRLEKEVNGIKLYRRLGLNTGPRGYN